MPQPAYRQAGVRIVIADDHRLLREALRGLLEGQPDLSVVGEAADADEALELTRQLKPDILLLDLAMPGRSGLETLEAIRASSYPTRVILLTAAIDRSDIVIALRLGARGLVLKESGSEVLLAAIRGVHAGQYWVGRDSVSDVLRVLGDLIHSSVDGRPNDFGLTPRELEIISAVVAACGNKEIAQKFAISEKTVKHHLTNIYNKLGVSNRLELAMFALHHHVKLPNVPA
jgi:two-component system nitrate/nitrite response regulator NarL